MAIRRHHATRMKVVGIGVIVVAAAVWAAGGTDFSIPKLVSGLPLTYELGGRMLPPDLSVLPGLMAPMLETLEMALLGTTFGVFFALPLAILATVTTTPHVAVSVVVRTLIGVLRTIPELIWAMMLVSAVGLGPFPGVLALTLHTSGALGKFFYEAIETANPGVIEAIESTGASRFKVTWFGVIPNVIPVMMSTTLWYWEYNNRSSAVLGLVGAGGIGLALYHALQDFRYPEVLTCILLVLAVLVVIDRISAHLRARII